MWIWTCLLVYVSLLVLPVWAEIVPLDRRITWNPGVRGGIPTTRTNILNVKNAPYNATGNGTTDDTAAIQAAINAAVTDDIVYLPTGAYRVTSTLTINKAITLRGDGPDFTDINWTPSTGGHILRVTGGGTIGGALSITAGGTKDSSSITISNASTIAVNDHIVITQTNIAGLVYDTGYGSQCTWCGNDNPTQAMAQLNRVTAKVSNTLTLERPLYYDQTNSPIVKRVTMTQRVGFEDFFIARTNSGSITGYNIYLQYCSNCWVKNVKSQEGGEAHFLLQNSYANTIRESWANHGYDSSGGKDYCFFMYFWNSEHLIENNIAESCRHTLVMEAGGSGNVYGYNYTVNEIQSNDPTFMSQSQGTHGAHPHMNLFEGNIVGNMDHDNTWGSASHNTSFRNWSRNFSGVGGVAFGLWAVDIEQHSYFNNIVGSVLGRPGDTGTQFLTSGSGKASYRFGFLSPGASSVSDSNVLATTYIHATYDYIGNQTLFDAGNADHTVPASLYLAGKPAWFGGLRWPMVGSDLTPMTGDIPAKIRFEGGTVPPDTGTVPVILRLIR
jgi:hypothetical protein